MNYAGWDEDLSRLLDCDGGYCWCRRLAMNIGATWWSCDDMLRSCVTMQLRADTFLKQHRIQRCILAWHWQQPTFEWLMARPLSLLRRCPWLFLVRHWHWVMMGSWSGHWMSRLRARNWDSLTQVSSNWDKTAFTPADKLKLPTGADILSMLSLIHNSFTYFCLTWEVDGDYVQDVFHKLSRSFFPSWIH